MCWVGKDIKIIQRSVRREVVSEDWGKEVGYGGLLFIHCYKFTSIVYWWGVYTNVPTNWIFLYLFNFSFCPHTCFSVHSWSSFPSLTTWLWFIILALGLVIHFCTYKCINLIAIIHIFFFLSFRRPLLLFFLNNFYNFPINFFVSGFPWEMLAGHSMKLQFWWKTLSTLSW